MLHVTHATEWSSANWGNYVAISSIRAAPFGNMCSTRADNDSTKLRLRCSCQFPWCAPGLRVGGCIANDSRLFQEATQLKGLLQTKIWGNWHNRNSPHHLTGPARNGGYVLRWSTTQRRREKKSLDVTQSNAFTQWSHYWHHSFVRYDNIGQSAQRATISL
jgi:hypothetical protein